MAIPEVTVTEKRQTVPDSSYLYDSVFRGLTARRMAEHGWYTLGDIPLGIPIGRADQPQEAFGVNLGASYKSTNVIQERDFERFAVQAAADAQAEAERLAQVRSGPPPCS